jgi:hypothetical protein
MPSQKIELEEELDTDAHVQYTLSGLQWHIAFSGPFAGYYGQLLHSYGGIGADEAGCTCNIAALLEFFFPPQIYS